jgi:dihydroxy-acid dehydratase
MRISVKERKIDLLISDEEFQKRSAAIRVAPVNPSLRGYSKLYQEQILQADEGCDFAFLKP